MGEEEKILPATNAGDAMMAAGLQAATCLSVSGAPVERNVDANSEAMGATKALLRAMPALFVLPVHSRHLSRMIDSMLACASTLLNKLVGSQ